MDEYWSPHRCGWAPCHGRHEALATPWSVRDDDPAPLPELVLPQQRAPRPAAVTT